MQHLKKKGILMEKELLLIELVSNVCKKIIGLSAITSLEMPMLIKMKKNDYDNLLKSRYTGIVKREEKNLTSRTGLVLSTICIKIMNARVSWTCPRSQRILNGIRKFFRPSAFMAIR